MAATAAGPTLGMTAEASQKPDGHRLWLAPVSQGAELRWSSQSCRCDLRTAVGHIAAWPGDRGLERTTAGQEMSQRNAALESPAFLMLLHK